MPRKTGTDVARVSDAITYQGLTPVVDKIVTVSTNVTDLTDMQEAGNEELSRIRRANEFILGQEVEDGE